MASRLVDVHTIALALHCSCRQVQNLVTLGMPKAGHGKYNLKACQKWMGKRTAGQRSAVVEKIHAARANHIVILWIRRVLLSLPRRIAPLLVMKKQAEIEHILRGVIRDVNAELFDITNLEE